MYHVISEIVICLPQFHMGHVLLAQHVDPCDVDKSLVENGAAAYVGSQTVFVQLLQIRSQDGVYRFRGNSENYTNVLQRRVTLQQRNYPIWLKKWKNILISTRGIINCRKIFRCIFVQNFDWKELLMSVWLSHLNVQLSEPLSEY